MKKFVVILVTMLFLALAGCVDYSNPSPQDVTQIIQGLTATAYTATPMNTPHPFEKEIVDRINRKLREQEMGDPLSKTLDASYIIVKASLSMGPGQVAPTHLSLEVHCECARNGSCCNVEHTFVVVVKAMESIGVEMIVWIPPTVLELQMLCYDHQSPIGGMSVPWPMMQEYILQHIDGYQLGGYVQGRSTPAP